MNILLLSVSETFSAFWDSASVFIQNCWGQLTASISISAVVFFLLKYILHKIKSNKTIRDAISKATGAVETSTTSVNKRIDEFEAKTTEMFAKFEENFEKKFEDKFDKLKEKRMIAYNSIMTGTNKIQEELNNANDFAQKIDAEMQKEAPAPDIKELADALNLPEIKAQEGETEVVEEIVESTTKQSTETTVVNENQVLR